MPDHAVVVGAGPAGLAAARTMAGHGWSVTVVDDNPAAGGQVWRGEQNETTAAVDGVDYLLGTRAIGLLEPNVLLAEDQHGPLSLGFDRLVIATGARERFLPFPGWTLPGVFGAGGLQALVKLGLAVAAKRVVVAGTGPLLLEVAGYLQSAGATVPLVAEQAPLRDLLTFLPALRRVPGKIAQAMSLAGGVATVFRSGTWVERAVGSDKLESVVVRSRTRTWEVQADYLACGFHLVPNIELAAVLGCRITEDGYVAVDGFQQTSVRGVYCAGEPTGISGVEKSQLEGEIAGHAAVGRSSAAEALFARRDRFRRFEAALEQVTRLRPELKSLAADDTIVCRCEDVPLERLQECDDWRCAKLLTRCGMGACQGRVCGSAVEFLFGWRNESIRPPVQPARVATLAAASIAAPGK